MVVLITLCKLHLRFDTRKLVLRTAQIHLGKGSSIPTFDGV